MMVIFLVIGSMTIWNGHDPLSADPVVVVPVTVQVFVVQVVVLPVVMVPVAVVPVVVVQLRTSPVVSALLVLLKMIIPSVPAITSPKSFL
jgi:hypothetical protein